MAFTQDTFAPVGPQSANSPSIYSYNTSDSVSDLTTTGYFSTKQHQLSQSDLIMASVSDANTFVILQVLADTSSVTNVSDEYVDNVTNTYIPIKAGDELANSPLRLEDGVLISSVTIQSPPASFSIGTNATLHDIGSGVGYTLNTQGSTFEIPGSLYSEADGQIVGLAVSDYLQTGAVDIPTQSSDVVTNSYEDYTWEAQIFTKAQDPTFGVDEDLFRVYRVTIRGDTGPQAPVRVRIYIQDPSVQLDAIPFYDNVASREPEWLAGEFGFVVSETGDSILEFKQGQRLRAGFKFYIRYSVPPGEQFTIKGDNVDIGFGVVFVPYQISRVLPGYEEDVSPPRERATVSTSDASWVTVITHPVALDSTENISFNAYGLEDGGSGIISGEVVATARNMAGVTSLIGDTICYRHRAGGTPNLRAEAGGSGNLLLQVKGTGGTNWNWRGIAQTREQKT
jgi:hypothetical protein